MITSFTHTTIINKKIIDYIEDESVSQKDIAIVDFEIIRELEELISIYF